MEGLEMRSTWCAWRDGAHTGDAGRRLWGLVLGQGGRKRGNWRQISMEGKANTYYWAPRVPGAGCEGDPHTCA